MLFAGQTKKLAEFVVIVAVLACVKWLDFHAPALLTYLAKQSSSFTSAGFRDRWQQQSGRNFLGVAARDSNVVGFTRPVPTADRAGTNDMGRPVAL